jgi:hypothetical protein
MFHVVGMNAEAIHRVAQSMPSHMLHSLSQVANQTPHYPPHTPGGPNFTGAPAYGAYANTVSHCLSSQAHDVSTLDTSEDIYSVQIFIDFTFDLRLQLTIFLILWINKKSFRYLFYSFARRFCKPQSFTCY